jgi:DNA helicase-2/ATP-dependent DNA helicase PcrA
VAATRAKENLFISYPIKIFDRGMGTVLSRPSQFIEGISGEMLEPITLVDEGDDRSWEE